MVFGFPRGKVDITGLRFPLQFLKFRGKIEKKVLGEIGAVVLREYIELFGKPNLSNRIDDQFPDRRLLLSIAIDLLYVLPGNNGPSTDFINGCINGGVLKPRYTKGFREEVEINKHIPTQVFRFLVVLQDASSVEPKLKIFEDFWVLVDELKLHLDGLLKGGLEDRRDIAQQSSMETED